MVERAQREGDPPTKRGDVDDRTGARASEMRQQRLRRRRRPDEVHVELPPEGAERRRFQRTIDTVAGIVTSTSSRSKAPIPRATAGPFGRHMTDLVGLRVLVLEDEATLAMPIVQVRSAF